MKPLEKNNEERAVIPTELYYYIDEAGTLNPCLNEKDRYFIISCFTTDTPDLLRTSLNILYQEILNDPYSGYDLEKFEKQGFHATENHFDIRTAYYRLLLTLNVRIYSVVIDKKSAAYADLISKHIDLSGVYYELMYVLLEKRIIDNRYNKNFLVFEEYGSKPSTHLAGIEKVLSAITHIINRDFMIPEVAISIEVHTKDDILLSIIDYANYIIFQMLQPKTDDRMIKNFNLISPKIGLLHSIHNQGFYSQKKRINFEEIKGQGNM